MSLPCLPDGPPISVPLLVEVLELCRETWIRDLLFKMEPTADVGILTSPGQLERATVLDEISSAFETTGQYCSMFDVISISRWLVVPVSFKTKTSALFSAIVF